MIELKIFLQGFPCLRLYMFSVRHTLLHSHMPASSRAKPHLHGVLPFAFMQQLQTGNDVDDTDASTIINHVNGVHYSFLNPEKLERGKKKIRGKIYPIKYAKIKTTLLFPWH
jgi:hypothetical protein